MAVPQINGPEIKGWCPGALRPMLSGDGWLVRIRAPMGRLTPAQAAGVAKAAMAHGNGVIDLSSRANLQLRGVREGAHAALINDLRALGLVDADEVAEAARNLVITPFRREGAAGVIDMIAAGLPLALRNLAPLPGKFGFAVDCGPQPVLGAVSADIRIECSGDGGLILRPDGHGFGRRISAETAITETVLLAEWFLSAGGVTAGRGRMAQLIAQGILPAGCTERPATPLPQPVPGPCADGLLVAFAFGQLRADTLLALANCDHNLVLTPWRMILLEGAQSVPADPALITRPDDPLLRVTACTGAPGCPQALGPTRALARGLAPLTPLPLHVSGCTKGCAHPGKSPLTLVATPDGYNLIRSGTAADAPQLTDLPPHLIPDALHAP